MKPYFSVIKEQTNRRSKESSLSILGVRQPSLRKHLADLLQSTEPFVKGPVFEQMFAWEKEESKTMQNLVSNKLLSQKLVSALDSNKNNEYRFGADWNPYKHQLQAWNDLLSSKTQSRVITSGTGSGKTECFMVPVIQDLLNKQSHENLPLQGVHALFLYPLNALINSQKERLDAWTKHFSGEIRFCLFNGNTVEKNSGKIRQEQKEKPQEVLSRELMRSNPAPIMVTNGTMLEYMLIRQSDAPIIEKSKGKLRWIILDEAHSYVGSQAAELALQLRRVMQAFKVNAKDVRFVATSATIAGTDAEAKLQKYLADLAGIDEHQVAVIGGRRITPKLKLNGKQTISLQEIQNIDAECEVSPSRFKALCHSKIACQIRSRLTNPKIKATSISDLHDDLRQYNLSENEIFQWLDLCTWTKEKKSGESFLKLRAHYFQRTLHGLWSCINKDCKAKKNSLIDDDWPFGYVYTKQKSRCECGYPVLELNFCNECKEPHLIGIDTNGQLNQWQTQVFDEFSLQSEGDTDEEKEDKIVSKDSLVFAAAEHCKAEGFNEELIGQDGKIGDLNNSVKLSVSYESLTHVSCAGCGFKGYGNYGKSLRHAILGAPFYLTNLVPNLLEFCPDFNHKSEGTDYGANSLPFRGRRMITFTDSRQGTARLSVKMQQDAERMLIRKLLVNELIRNINQNDEKYDVSELPKSSHKFLKYEIEILETLKDLPQYKDFDLEKVIAIKNKGPIQSLVYKNIKWREILTAVAKNRKLSELATIENLQWLENNEHQATEFAEVLMLRELARRPKNQNSLETLGLIKLIYPVIEKVSTVPAQWLENNLSLSDWKDFLKVIMDFFVRENSIFSITRTQKNFIGMRFSSKQLISFESDDSSDMNVKKWPQVKATGNPSRLVKLLCLGAGLDLNQTGQVDDINLWLQDAWVVIRKQLRNDNSQYQLNFSDIELGLVDQAYVCPVTNKLIANTFKGYTPYLPSLKNIISSEFLCEQVEIPCLKDFEVDTSPELHIAKVREVIANNAEVQTLRENNLWTDITDRIIEGEDYYTVAEHSAQQSSERLQQYELKFKEGKKNVLNCSTTMEMGVDIGGISTVLMNNVPPHPANYLQRAGRAGRSQESRAMSYTLCKHNPHDLKVFSDNSWAFETAILPPFVTFSASKLVNRHVNAYILAEFLKMHQMKEEKIALKTEWFYTGGEASKANELLKFMDNLSSKNESDINELIRGTASTELSLKEIIEEGKDTIIKCNNVWSKQIEHIEKEKKTAPKDGPYFFKLEREEKRLNVDNVIMHLSQRGFLPGYGFPTDVVTFDNDNVSDFIRRNKLNKKNQRLALPSRNLAVAIREYAPGADVVLDGKVFRSKGLKLSAQYAFDSTSVDAQKFNRAWHCNKCGQMGFNEGLSEDDSLFCSNLDCGSEIPLDNQHATIEPMGFAVDYYDEPNNNVEYQKFMPFNRPWVIADNAWVALPRAELGYMRSDVNGSVYHYSSGFDGKGYALCLSCGRSESMLDEGIPKSMIEHKPLRPDKFSKDSKTNKRKECKSKIETNLRIGFKAQTDVFELTLKNINSEWISPIKGCNEGRGRTIATTLAVALRSSLAGILGISKNEISYATRQTKNKAGEIVYTIQLFDTVSGGAGFSTESPNLINILLKQMVQNLNCDQGCEAYCSSCLLEHDSRHDVDSLNRLLALEWLGSGYSDRLETNYEWTTMPEPRYVVDNLKQKLTALMRYKTDGISFVWHTDSELWDTSRAFVEQVIHQIKAKNTNTQINIVVPNPIDNDEIKLFLYNVSSLGVNIVTASVSSHAVYQIKQNSQVNTVENEFTACQIPGEKWLESQGTTIESSQVPEWELEVLDTSAWQNKSAETSADTKTIIFSSEMNGPLSQMGAKFQQLIKKEAPEIFECICNEKIESIKYTDRFLKSPQSFLLLSHLIKGFALNEEVKVHIVTSSDNNSHYSNRLFHDWTNPSAHESVIRLFLEKHVLQSNPASSVVVEVLNKRTELIHARSMSLTTTQGNEFKMNFDWGMGGWKLYKKQRNQLQFDFALNVNDQVELLINEARTLMVTELKPGAENFFYLIE